MEKSPTSVALLLFLPIVVITILSGCPNPEAPPTDTTSPIGTVTVNHDDDYTVSTSVTLTLDAFDDRGFGGMQMMISNSDDFSVSSWEVFTTIRTWNLSAGDGTKTVCVKFKDAAGNESAMCSDSILLDPSLPGPPSTPDLESADDTGVSYNDDITQQTTALTFFGSGAQSETSVRLYDSGSGLLGSATSKLNGDWNIDLDLGEGVYALFARSVVNSIYESPASVALVVTVDTTPPKAPNILKPLQGENTGSNKRPNFTWTADVDAFAYELEACISPGFDSIGYAWTNLSGTSYTPSSDMSASNASPVGTRYYLRMRAFDAAGNTGEWSNTGLIRYVNVGRFDSDFNGDGYADALVGAPGYNSGDGRGYIYFGGPSMDNVADLDLTASATWSIGLSVSSAGDVNGDGYADAIVGSNGWAHIYFGGTSMDNTADLTMSERGANDNQSFGNSVASAGDVNGDGFTDVIVGREGYYYHEGRAYIYFGGSSMDITADLIMSGEATFNYFGWSVASAGDVNGDGYLDVIVGACGFNISQGRAYIFYGGSAMDFTADLTMTGETGDVWFGRCVSSAGDVNGDGYADAIVGAPAYKGEQGRVHIYYGGSTMNNGPDVTMIGEATPSWFGRCVSSAGDVNGDGYTDVIAGARINDQSQTYIYYGGASMNNTADLTMTDGLSTGYLYEPNIASAGDVNGDGYADVIVGAPADDSSQGRAFLYYGGASMDNFADVTMTGTGPGVRFGASVAEAIDDYTPPDDRWRKFAGLPGSRGMPSLVCITFRSWLQLSRSKKSSSPS